MKGKVKRILSGVLSVMTILTSFVQPVATYAAENPAAYESEYPALKAVRDKLADGEVVTAKDYEVETGSSFNVKKDFSGMEINTGKVKVTFHEAKDSDGKDFNVNRAGTYRAVYFVKPLSGNPSYHVTRRLIVKEPSKAAEKKPSTVLTGKVEKSEETESEEETEAQSEGMTEADRKKVAAMSEQEIHKEGAALVEQAVQSGEPEISFEGEEQALYLAYQNLLKSGNDNGIMLMANEDNLVVKNANGESGMWNLPLLDYIYSSKTGGQVHNYVKYIANDSANGWRLAYCTQLTKHFIDSTSYINKTWKASGMYAEISYAIAHGCSVYQDTNDSAYSTGNWLKDYYVTQTVIYCILEDYGFDGHALSSLSAVSGYQDVYNCVQAMYQDVKKNGNKAGDGYGDNPYYKIVPPDSTAMEVNSDETYYQTGWYSIEKNGDIKSRNITLSGAPEGTEIVYKDSGSLTSKFYIRIPVAKAYAIGDKTVTFKVKATAKFSRPYTYIYESLVADAQNITFLEKHTTEAPKSSEANVSLKLAKAKVEVVKVDSQNPDARLSSAVFGIFKDQACTQLITQMPATDSKGASSAEIVKSQETVYLKEITAPHGYRINTTAYNVKLVAKKSTSTTVPDQEQLGELTVYKEGQVLIGADIGAEGSTFRYELRRQPGTIYNVYAGEDIHTAYGAEVYKKGALVKENLTTDNNGAVTLKNLHLGKYIVREMKAPKNLYNPGEEKPVTLTYAGQNAEVTFSETTFENDRQKAAVSVVKKDKDTLNPLDGGIFGLYAGCDITNADGAVVMSKGTLIEKATTGEDGKAVFQSDLPVGFGYDVKEVQAPEGYLRNTSDVYSFQFTYTNDKEPLLTFTHTFTNERVNAKIALQKKDLETNKAVPQGDATLEAAVYGLYARADIVHPDGATGVLYKAGDKVATLTTDAEGKASVENLYLGSYYVKEITPPAGYLADPAEYDLSCDYEGDLVATVKRECGSPEQVIKQPFQIIKAADNGKTDADLLSGAGFTAYLVSSLKEKKDGSYDFSSAEPVVIGENHATEIFTDERGYACSIPLPYGTYIVRETTTPHNYTPVKDFIVRITEHKPKTPQVWRVLLDDEFEAKLRIVKQDDETKRSVLAKDTEFKIYDLDNEKYVEQVTTYPTITVHESFFTDENGCLVLPQNLKIGNYRIEEAHAPYGYTLNRNYVEIAVDSNTLYQMDSVSGDVIIDVTYENHPVKGELRIEKKGEVLNGFDKDFSYQKEKLSGAVFEVYAAENIYTADFQKDGDGKRILEYAAGELVDTLTTDEAGSAVLSDLPLGKYQVVETKAPEGFVLNGEEQTVTFAYADQDTPVVRQTAVFENDRQKVEISVLKKDAKTGNVVAGAVFGLYAKADIAAHGEVIVKADTRLGEAVTGEDGTAAFGLDVPFGEYYVKEEKAPAGYVSSAEVIDVTASYQGQDMPVVSLVSEYRNEPTVIAVKKTDIDTGVELAGATLSVVDQDGNVVDTWTSVKGEEHLIERLTVGETYTLREEMAPYGYLVAKEVSFVVEDTAEIQEVEMQDDVPTGLLIINKKGEFLDNVSPLDSIGGWIVHLFSYLSGALKDVTFEVYALEDVRAADGESADYYKADELVATITTDDTGYAKLENLPLGKYYVKEKETAEGYVLDGERREIDLTYRDQDTAVVTYSTDWQNNRQKAEVTVLKKEKDTDRMLSGAVFALCAKEDVTNTAGEVIMEADTVIEEKATDKDGKLTFEADLPIGFAYYVKETSPAPGFATTAEVQEFVFDYEGADKVSAAFEFTFEDEPTSFAFTKTSLTDGKEVEGTTLQVLDESGEVVEEWISGKEPHILTELTVGKTYILRETMPAAGYVTAQDVEFVVGDTAEVQKVEMQDDVTKLEISKQDISGKELPGAKLSILDKEGKTVESWTSTDKPYYMEMLPIGVYTLHEEAAPEGYVVANDVTFEVKDTGEVQKVVMVDEAKPSEPDSPAPTADTPKTGDDSHLALWLILAALGACGLVGGIMLFGKKKED